MKKHLITALFLASAVALFSQNNTFAEKYLQARKSAATNEIQSFTLPGDSIVRTLKDSIGQMELTPKERKRFENVFDHIDRITIVADANKPTQNNGDGVEVKALFDKLEELMMYNLSGMMQATILSNGNKKINNLVICLEMGEPENMPGKTKDLFSKFGNGTSTLNFKMGDKPIQLTGNHICILVDFTFSKPVPEEDVLFAIKKLSAETSASTEKNSGNSGLSSMIHSEEDIADSDIIDTDLYNEKIIFPIEYKGNTLYFKGTVANVLDSINKGANFFSYKMIQGTSLTAPSDGSSYSGNIDIPSQVTYNGKVYPVLCIDLKAFQKSDITSVTLPESLISIGMHAFDSCANLKKIVVPNSVKHIGTAAFQSCRQLESVTLSENLYDLGGFSFNGCSSLTSIHLPDSLRMIGEYAFAVCDFKEFTFSNVKEIPNGILSNCKQLETVTMPASVQSIHKNSLFNNPRLTTIILKVKEPPFIKEAFFWSKEKVTIKVPSTSLQAYKTAPVWDTLNIGAEN